MNLDQIFSDIKFSTILTTGRTGSDYLHGCLDNVPGILTFSGRFAYFKFCDSLKEDQFQNTNSGDILEIFIKKNYYLFTKDHIENKSIDLDIKIFKENFLKVSENKKINKQKFLLAIYLAYNLTLDRKISNLKTMVHHSHSVTETYRFLKSFNNSKLLITIRDPRANLKSGIINWIKYDNQTENQKHFYKYLKRIREDLKFAKKQNNNKFFLKLEEANDVSVKQKLSDFLDVKFSEEIMKATFAGKVWSGDKLSQYPPTNGEYNKNVKNNNWEDFFNKKDKEILNLVYKDYVMFNYKLNPVSVFKRFYLFFLIPLPFSFDKKVLSLKYNLKKNIINIFYYFLRILYLYKLLFKLH